MADSVNISANVQAGSPLNGNTANGVTISATVSAGTVASGIVTTGGIGPEGPQGIQGIQGETGLTGPQGIPGDTAGPSSATDNAIARYDGTTGKLLQNSSATLSDDGSISSSSTQIGSQGNDESSSQYTPTSTTYSQDTLTGGAVQAVTGDDTLSSSISIGFTFQYFGINYTTFKASTNGFISLSPSQTLSFPGAASLSGGVTPKGSILGYHSDLNAAAAQINYELFGTAPNRRLVIHYNNVPHYDFPAQFANLQIKLFETSNNIEIHTASLPSSASGVQGLVGHSTANYSEFSGRGTFGIKTYSNDGVRFSYNGLSLRALATGQASVSNKLYADLVEPYTSGGEVSVGGVLFKNGQYDGGTILNTVSVQTVSNKKLIPRVRSQALDGAVQFDPAYDLELITAQSAAMDFTSPTGSPSDGTRMMCRITDNGIARAITWNATYYRAVGVVLPTTTVAGKTLYVGLMYNSQISKWDVIDLYLEGRLGSVDVQTFTSTGTWVKPEGARSVHIFGIGAGGGGGSGRKGATATVICGGGGGGAGAIGSLTLPADALPSSVTATVGAGGAGGALISTDSTDGNSGVDGGSTSFFNFIAFGRGRAGLGGTASSGSGGGASTGIPNATGYNGGTGASASTTGGTGSNAPSTIYASTGGGAGGGRTTGNTAGNGGSSGTFGSGAQNTFTTTSTANVSPSAGGGSNVAGGNGAVRSSSLLVGSTGGGGGGASAFGGAGGAGGTGGSWGAGGGGGGAGADSSGNSGAGGAGGPGIIVVTTYL